MDLTKINLKGYGSFGEKPGTFTCKKYHLPREWDWVYTNGDALLRLCHRGTGYLQIDPPGGSALFKMDRGETTPKMMVWLIPDEEKDSPGAFCNFYRPTVPAERPDAEPDDYSCNFTPEAAHYSLTRNDWAVKTEMMIPPKGSTVIMTVSVTNNSRKTRKITLMPVVKPHMATFNLAPWDIPHLYQTSSFFKQKDEASFFLETRNPGGDPSLRLRAGVVTDLKPTHFEPGCDNFCGEGTWDNPQAVWDGKLARTIGNKKWSYGKVEKSNSIVCLPPVAAFSRKITLKPGETFTFTTVFGKLRDMTKGEMPPRSSFNDISQYLKENKREQAKTTIRKKFTKMFGNYSLNTPDDALNRYFTEFLMMQIYWVTMLDRGWPTGLRGVRDAAQDVTGAIPTNPELAKTRLRELFSCERSDGWFVRQYSTSGPEGQHDMREYVDSAIWVWECLYEYICHTRNFKILDEKLRWLDSKNTDTVLTHAIRLFEYYTAAKNLGKHGLCKIREGDWNDSVNRAGVLGKGESVMVSCQVVLGLRQLVKLLNLQNNGRKPTATAKKFAAAADKLEKNLIRHAFNKNGYFNGVYNDAGKWMFSPKDPDGKKRISGTVNSFAIISGVAKGAKRNSVMKALATLKGPHGWRLFYPGVGTPPIDNLGRLGSGDLLPGVGENGTCYNHGAHGFLGRAAWTCGMGDMLYEILRHMLPYDQKAHPIDVSHAAPYGVNNHWREAIAIDGDGGDVFLSGSITTAIRNIYQGMVGFRPGYTDLIIDPSIPTKWKKLEATIPFLGTDCKIVIRNPSAKESGIVECKVDGLNGSFIQNYRTLGRKVVAIPINKLNTGKKIAIEVTIG